MTEYSKEQWFQVARACSPTITWEVFCEMWADMAYKRIAMAEDDEYFCRMIRAKPGE